MLLRGPHRGVSAARNAALGRGAGRVRGKPRRGRRLLARAARSARRPRDGTFRSGHPRDRRLVRGYDGRRRGRFNRLNAFPCRRSAGRHPVHVLRSFTRGAPRVRLLEVGGFDESLTRRWKTGTAGYRLVLDGARVGLVDEALYAYRIRRGQPHRGPPRCHCEAASLMLDKVAARRDLEAGEVALVRTLRDQRHREALLAEAEAALLGRQPDARQARLRVATGLGLRRGNASSRRPSPRSPRRWPPARSIRRASSVGTKAVRPGPRRAR